MRSAWLSWAGAGAALGALGLAATSPAAAARGWLIGFVACATPVLGCILLTLVGDLTGGRWGKWTRPITGAAPGLLPIALPLGLGLEWIFPWALGGGLPGHSGVYLNEGFFVARSLVALGAWGALGWLLGRRDLSRLMLGLGVFAHAVLAIVVAFDWVLSLRPGWVSSDFPMNLIAQQIAAGAALSLLLAGQAAARERRDLATLMAAGVLGVAYLAFMDYLIVWYGNLPDRVGWYLERQPTAWLAAVALVVGGLAAPLVLLAPRLTLRFKSGLAAALALAGSLAFQLYLFTPLLDGASLAGAVLSAVAQAAVLSAVARHWPASLISRRPAHG